MSELKGKTGANPSPADSIQLLHVVTAMNMIRMNLGMYPPGHIRITECVDYAFDMIQKILEDTSELLIGFPGDKIMFGETASDREKNNTVFRDYAHCLNNLRIVSFTLLRDLSRKDLLEFNRILTAKPADIWAMGKIESVFSRTGIKGIRIKVVDADFFRLEGKDKILQPGPGEKIKENLFWQELISSRKAGALSTTQGVGIPAAHEETGPAEVARLLNQQKGNWSSAVSGYEKMISDYLSEIPKGKEASAEKYEALSGVNSIISSLNPELKKQLTEVVERQLSLHKDKALAEEDLKCFSDETFIEIIRRTNEKGTQISPTLVNLLKKMSGIHESEVPPDGMKEKGFVSGDMETLFKREKYEKYVPEEYDKILQKAAGAYSSEKDKEDSSFPVHEYLKTMSHDFVDFQICQLVHFLMDGETLLEDYLAWAEKLSKSIHQLIKAGKFNFLITAMETLRRHAIEKSDEIIRQKAKSILGQFSEKGTIARLVAPFILKGTEEPAVLTQFLISSSIQNLSWLFDLYLDPKVPPSASITEVIKGFGKSATDEAVKRLSEKGPQGIIRLLAFFREMNDRSVIPSVKNLSYHSDWPVRREVIRTLIQFDDPAVIELLQNSLKSKDHDEMIEAIGLSCRYRAGDMLKDLTAMLKINVIREDDAILNEWILSELTKSGHPSVIPFLEKIVATTFTLSPKYLSRMKIIIYRNLHNFPINMVRNLLHKGNASRNEEIKIISAKLLESTE
jgi:hypothetical protein